MSNHIMRPLPVTTIRLEHEQKVCILYWLTVLTLLVVCPRCYSEAEVEAEFTLPPLDAYTLQYALRDHHSQEAIQHHQNYTFSKTYQGSAATRKMMQLMLKGAWLSYREDAITYFFSTENEVNEFSNEEELNASFILSRQALRYKMRLSPKKLIINVSYDF